MRNARSMAGLVHMKVASWGRVTHSCEVCSRLLKSRPGTAPPFLLLVGGALWASCLGGHTVLLYWREDGVMQRQVEPRCGEHLKQALGGHSGASTTAESELPWFGRKVMFTRFAVAQAQPHGLQHSSLPCPSPSPGACSTSCPTSWWCHPTISSSVIPFSSLQFFPASRSFPVSSSGGQSIGTSASASVFLANIQSWFPLGWANLIFLLSRGLSRVFSNTTV